MFRLLCLVLGAGAWEQDRPEKAGVSESRGRGLPDCPGRRGLPADLGPDTKAGALGKCDAKGTPPWISRPRAAASYLLGLGGGRLPT